MASVEVRGSFPETQVAQAMLRQVSTSGSVATPSVSLRVSASLWPQLVAEHRLHSSRADASALRPR
jgi:hypothetical protein